MCNFCVRFWCPTHFQMTFLDKEMIGIWCISSWTECLLNSSLQIETDIKIIVRFQPIILIIITREYCRAVITPSVSLMFNPVKAWITAPRRYIPTLHVRCTPSLNLFSAYKQIRLKTFVATGIATLCLFLISFHSLAKPWYFAMKSLQFSVSKFWTG